MVQQVLTMLVSFLSIAIDPRGIVLDSSHGLWSVVKGSQWWQFGSVGIGIRVGAI